MDWLSLPPLSALRAFAALAETGSYTAAGARLGVSHAAVSQQVRGLEDRLGAQLMRKAGRGAALTPEGERLAAAILPAFLAMSRTVDELTGADAARPLQVTTTPAFAGRWLVPRLSEFRHLHPDIELMLQPTATLVELAPGGVDVGVRFGRGSWPGLEARPLVMTDLAVVASRRLVGERRISAPGELLAYPWLQELGTSEMSEWFARRGVVVPRKEDVIHLPGYLVVDALLAGDGVTVVARANVEHEIADGRLRVLFEDALPGQGYYVVTRPGVLRPPLKIFVNWLLRHGDTGAEASGAVMTAMHHDRGRT